MMSSTGIIAAVAGALGLALGYILCLRGKVRRVTAEARAAREIIGEMGNEHWTFLAMSSRALSASLDYPTILRKVGRIAVPELADFCEVVVLEDDGTLTRMSCGLDAGGSPGEPSLQERQPCEGPLSGVVALGRPERDERSIALPLRSRGSCLGAISFGHWDTLSPVLSSREKLFEQLASQVALVVDNARLYARAQQEASARERLLATISHDLQNPLFAMDMSAQLILSSPILAGKESSQEYAMVENIRRSVGRMSALSRDLVDAAKIRVGSFVVRPKPERLSALLSSYAEFAWVLAAAKGIRVETEPLSRDVDVLVEQEALFRVVANIVGNAVKFTPKEGVIRIGATVNGAFAEFWVMDSGPGIASEDLPRIFEEFWQAKETASLGTGLGLAIAKGIVAAHGGTIVAESPAGGGARFRFTVPKLTPLSGAPD